MPHAYDNRFIKTVPYSTVEGKKTRGRPPKKRVDKTTGRTGLNFVKHKDYHMTDINRKNSYLARTVH